MNQDIRTEIEKIIKDEVRKIGRPDLFREPMVGFVSVDDPAIVNVKEIVGPGMIHLRTSFQAQGP